MKSLTLILMTCLLAFVAHADERQWYPYASGLGADGYDVVMYFTDKRAVRGRSEYTANYGGRMWHFSNSRHRDTFIAAPARYVPRYGGYCAYTASQNKLAFGDPQEWVVHNGALYFHYNAPNRKRWTWKAETYIENADRYWPELVARDR